MEAIVPQEFEIGEIVWAKMRGYPHWPALIIKPPSSDTVKMSHKYVLFFGGKEHGSISSKNIWDFDANYEMFSKHKKVNFQISLKAVEKYKKNVEKNKYKRNLKRRIELLKELLCICSDEAREDLMNEILRKQNICKENEASHQNGDDLLLPPAPLNQSNVPVAIKCEFEIHDETSDITNPVSAFDTKPIIVSTESARDILSMDGTPPACLQGLKEKMIMHVSIPDATSESQTFERTPCVTSDCEGCAPVEASKTSDSRITGITEMSFMPAGEGPSTSTKIFEFSENKATNSKSDKSCMKKKHNVVETGDKKGKRKQIPTKAKQNDIVKKPVKRKTLQKLKPVKKNVVQPKSIKSSILNLKKQAAHFRGKIHKPKQVRDAEAIDKKRKCCATETSKKSCIHSNQIESPENVKRLAMRKEGVQASCEDLPRKIPNCSARIGFIGMGDVSLYLSRMLIDFGYTVAIYHEPWDVSDLSSGNVRFYHSPAEVVITSDIIFCTFWERETTGHVIHGDSCFCHCGLEALKAGGSQKGFVMLTVLIPVLSKQLSEEIAKRGSKYLEALFLPEMKLNDNFFLICGGDLSLYHEVSECLCCTGISLNYISPQIGDAVIMKQAYLIMYTSSILHIAEMISFAQCCSVSLNSLLSIIRDMNAPPLIVQTIEDMLNHDFTKRATIFEAQENLSQVLQSHPDANLRITVAAHELLKLGSRFGLQYEDVGSVIKFLSPRRHHE